MKLLVVGGSGFIGRNVIERLAAGDHPFRHVTATYHRGGDFPAWANQLGVEALCLNLADPVTLASAFDAAIYTAGNADHATAADQPLADAELNATAMVRFLEAFRGRLVYLSSGAVYYGLSGEVNPGLPLRPPLAYGISKLTSELYAGAARARGRLSSLATLRLFYAFGRHDKPRRLVPRVLAAAREGGATTLRVNGSGRSYMDPLDATFVADVLVKIAARPKVEGIFDLCGGANRTVVEFASEVARIAGSSMAVEASGAPEEFPVTFFASPREVFAAAGVSAPRSYEAGVRNTMAWLEEARRGH